MFRAFTQHASPYEADKGSLNYGSDETSQPQEFIILTLSWTEIVFEWIQSFFLID